MALLRQFRTVLQHLTIVLQLWTATARQLLEEQSFADNKAVEPNTHIEYSKF